MQARHLCRSWNYSLLLQVRDLNCVVEHLQQSQRDLRNTIKVGGIIAVSWSGGTSAVQQAPKPWRGRAILSWKPH